MCAVPNVVMPNHIPLLIIGIPVKRNGQAVPYGRTHRFVHIPEPVGRILTACVNRHGGMVKTIPYEPTGVSPSL